MFVFAILSTVFSIVGPKILGKATTRIFENVLAKFTAARAHRPIPGMDFGYIGQIVLLLIGLYLISAVFNYAQQFVMAGVAQKTVYAGCGRTWIASLPGCRSGSSTRAPTARS